MPISKFMLHRRITSSSRDAARARVGTMTSSQSPNQAILDSVANPTVRVLRLLRNALPRAESQLEWQAAQFALSSNIRPWKEFR
jgi:hypothetical protein